mgnify:CR=1 FL=1
MENPTLILTVDLNTNKEKYLNYFKQRYGYEDTPAEVVKTE